MTLTESTVSLSSVRQLTEQLAAPLSPEDQTIQSMPDVSPTKWHRAHTTWFFETFLLEPLLGGYSTFDEQFAYLFNSYYEALGDRHPRVARGMISRPGAATVGRYRAHVDDALVRLVERVSDPDHAALLQVGLHHEQQHQELLLMDALHVLSGHPDPAAYRCDLRRSGGSTSARPTGWIELDEGVAQIGHDGSGFCFDNEQPRHHVMIGASQVADRLVTCGEWLEFIDDGGYQRPELWMSDGWAQVRADGWTAPLYWSSDGAVWSVFDLSGQRRVDPAEPVAHVSWYEADAFARWSGARLPTEQEWELAATAPAAGAHLQLDVLGVRPASSSADPLQFFGELWQWTESAYRPYPRYQPPTGALGEYNGKFMVNQQVLRGSSFATPEGHARSTYRNFFPPGARWMFAGVRLARDSG